MKKVILCAVSVILLLTLCGCAGKMVPVPDNLVEATDAEVNINSEVKMYPAENPDFTGRTKMVIQNETSNIVGYGDDVKIQVLLNGKWYETKPYSFPAPLYEITPGSKAEFVMYWEEYWDNRPLDKGHYRLLKECLVRTESQKDAAFCYIAYEFDL